MLSDELIQFLNSKNYFLLKKEVDGKLNSILYSVQKSILEAWNSKDDWNLPGEVSRVARKINKGNNYKGFPYQVFDFPSILQEKDIFSFRVIVWYGNLFSVNLIISDKFIPLFENRLDQFCKRETYLLKSQKVWETDTSDLDRLLISEESLGEVLSYFQKNNSIRLFRLFKMNQINDINRLTVECFNDWFAK
ncbi:MAG: hypothetical protein HWE21_17935 [Cytophagia bacterium]|nr:hypothetical protein [Cytophagia bacterium]